MARPSSTGYSRGCFLSSLARDWPKLGAVARLSGMELAGAAAVVQHEGMVELERK